MAVRLILLHKQKTSAMVRFLCLSDGLLAFTPTPAGTCLHDEAWSPAVDVHPAQHMAAAAEHLGLPAGAIEAESGFRVWLDTPEGDLLVLMGAFTTIDPPVEAAERVGGRFIHMMEARRLNPLDQQLIRRAYEHVLG